MDRIFAFIQVNALTLLCWSVAFFAFKDYLSHPHQKVTVEALAHTSGPVKHLAGTASLPSGFQTGYWLMLDDPRRDFAVPLALDYRKLADEVHEGTIVTVGYSPEVNPEKAKESVAAFSLKRGDVEYLPTDTLVRAYNASLDKKLRLAEGCTLGGFLALGVVWAVRRKMRQRAA